MIRGRKSYQSSHDRYNFSHCEATPKYPLVNLPYCSTTSLSTRNSLIAVLWIFLGFVFVLQLAYSNFPNVTEEEKDHLKIPFNIEEAKQLGVVLNRYKGDHYYQVLLGVSLVYIFLQTFAIPGSLFLSILSGFLFPFSVALSLVCTCSAIGASMCFLLSQLLGRKIIMTYFPKRAEKWAAQVNNHKDNLLNYIIFLRVTPFLPNWFINLTAPVIGVPLMPFALGTFIGVAPPSFIAIQTGKTLQNMTSADGALNLNSAALLILFGVISLIPVVLKNKLRNKMN
ncbi:hypothetical protein WA026_006038 [Henosepilachna vigintioctopunctata]